MTTRFLKFCNRARELNAVALLSAAAVFFAGGVSQVGVAVNYNQSAPDLGMVQRGAV